MGFLNYLDEAVNAAGADYPAPKDDKDMWEASLRPDAANLVALYLVGDLLQSRTFKNACLDKLISLCVNTDAVPWPATVRYAYASTPAGSKLRTFLTHLIHYSGGPHHRTANLNRAQDPDFVLDLAQIANLSKVVQSLPVPYSMGERDICDAYHEHTLYERCYNTGKPAQASSSQAGDSTARPSTSKPSQAGSAYQQTSRTQASATVTPPSGNSPARSQTQGTSSTPGFITSPGGTTWQHTYTRRVGRPPASTSGTSGASSQTSPTSQPLFNLFPNPSPYTQFPRANGGREERLNPMRAKLGESRKRNWGG